MNRNDAVRLRKAIVKGSESLPDSIATDVPDLYDSWQTGTGYLVGDRRKYNGILWKCIQNHTSQDDWTPDVAASLWVRTSADEWPEWVQPTGAHDAYNMGDKVSHNNKHWVSSIDGNIWEPGAAGTESLWSEAE